MHNDNDGLARRVLDAVPFWVEVLYSDSMDAQVSVDGRVEEISDISMEALLALVDEAASRAEDAY